MFKLFLWIVLKHNYLCLLVGQAILEYPVLLGHPFRLGVLVVLDLPLGPQGLDLPMALLALSILGLLVFRLALLHQAHPAVLVHPFVLGLLFGLVVQWPQLAQLGQAGLVGPQVLC